MLVTNKTDYFVTGTSIHIVEYDPCWKIRFNEFKDVLWPVVADHSIGFEHVGSTAVGGLAAKPIIDIDIIVSNMNALLKVIERLVPLGYVHQGELGIQGRHAFFQQENVSKLHLYVCLEGSLGLRNHLALRDYLRAHPSAVKEYSNLKKRLAQQYPNNIDCYVEGKTSFIAAILELCSFTPCELLNVLSSNQSLKQLSNQIHNLPSYFCHVDLG